MRWDWVVVGIGIIFVPALALGQGIPATTILYLTAIFGVMGLAFIIYGFESKTDAEKLAKLKLKQELDRMKKEESKGGA